MISPAFNAPVGDPPFRLIAIVSATSGIEELYELAGRWPSIRFGMMLRDPHHRRSVVEALAADALRLGAPPGVALIANGFPVPGIRYLHGTSAMLRERGSGEPMPPAEDDDACGDLIVGYSVHDLAEAELAVAAGSRYVTFSPVFPTASKPGHPGAGLNALRLICAALPLPVFALGGITAANAGAVLAAGAHGIASISLFARDARTALEGVLGFLSQSSIINRQS